MGERSAKEQAAANDLRHVTAMLSRAALRAEVTAGNIAGGEPIGPLAPMRDNLAAVAGWLRQAEVALAEFRAAGGAPDGVHVDLDGRPIDGHMWHVVRGGAVVARGWALARDDAEAQAQAVWEQGDE